MMEDNTKTQLITKESFINTLNFNGGFHYSDSEKHRTWINSQAYKKLSEYENMLRFSRLAKINNPNNFLMEYLSERTSHKYFERFNKLFMEDKATQESFLFSKELLNIYE